MHTRFVCNIVKYYYNLKPLFSVVVFNIFESVIYLCDGTAKISAAITPVSHDPSEIILIC